MRKACLFVVLLILLLSRADLLLAQPNILYFMKGIVQTKDLNPARPGIQRGFYISLPGLSKIDMSANTNNWSYNDLIHPGNGDRKDSLVWDFTNFLSSLDQDNFMMESAGLTLVDIGYKKGKAFYGFSWSEREYSEPFFDKELVNMLYYGNWPIIGSTYHSGYFGASGAHYREFAFTYAKDVSKKLSVGLTAKLLFGMAGVKTSGLNVVAGMPKSGDEIDLGASGQAFLSAPVTFRLVNEGGYKLYSKNNFDAFSYLTNFGNPGLAVDLGLSNQVSEEFEFSISLVDLGFITWKQDITTFTESGHFLFKGINLDDPANKPPTTTNARGLFLALRDSMRNAFLPLQTNSDFNTLLPVKLFVAGEYQVNEDFSLGGLLRVRMLNNMLHGAFTASANARMSKSFSFSASYSMMEGTYDNIGLGTILRAGKVQFYAASDNVFSIFNPSAARNMNLRVGVNLLFQDEPRRRKGVYGR